jgi:hypothetical protein
MIDPKATGATYRHDQGLIFVVLRHEPRFHRVVALALVDEFGPLGCTLIYIGKESCFWWESILFASPKEQGSMNE